MERYMEHFLNMPSDDLRELYEDHKRNLKVLGWKQGIFACHTHLLQLV